MGKLEKVVVLAVLLLVAVILGVSLNAPTGVRAAEAPEETLARAEPLPAAERQSPVPAPAPARPEASRPGRSAPVSRPAPMQASPETARAGADSTRPLGPAGVLSTSRPAAAPAQPARAEAGGLDEGPGNGYLRTLTGLTPSLSEEFMIYTWQEGDSFAAVSERYFGSRLHVNRLLRNNEGLADSDLRPGDQILVPARGQEEEEVAGSWSGAATYKVQPGDVLGTISSTVYGTSKSWRKIYDANRDLLADPNRLEVGMVLRIPE